MQADGVEAGVAPWLVAFAAISYAGIMFLVAWRAEDTPEEQSGLRRRWPLIYALSIGVYFTSWTYFGATGTAAREGWNYLPIYLGPALMFLFGMAFLERLGHAVLTERSLSIADFISTRFGRSRSLAAMVAFVALIGALPYVALQLKAVGMSFAEIVRGRPGAGEQALADQAVLIATLALAAFTMLFGARRYDASGRNRGLVISMALDSAVKLAALLCCGLFALSLLGQADAVTLIAAERRMAELFDPSRLEISFLTITLLSTAAIVCLPRQFYITFVELRGEGHLRAARWPFLIYLALTTAVVAPMTLAGFALLPNDARADLYVLDLPLMTGNYTLALFVFVGGFAAAAGMIVVATLALATMITNDLVTPLLLRNSQIVRGAEIGRLLLFVRRVAILGVLLLAYGYYLAVDQAATLAAIGLIAFSAVVQFAPALVGAVYRFDWSERAVRLGLAAGAAAWAYTLLLPSYLGADGLAQSWVAIWLGGLLHPQALLGAPLADPLTHGVVWSLGINLAVTAYVAWSERTAGAQRPALFRRVARIGQARTVGDLVDLSRRFVGPDAAQAAFTAAFAERGLALRYDAPPDRASARLAEKLVAQVIGAPSARVIVGSALSGAALDVNRVVRMLDETSQELQFSREILASTLEHISQGVSVVDKDLNLIAWNARYLEFFDFPPNFIAVGRPIAEVIRYNAERGECGPGEVDAHVEKRLAHMKRGQAHIYERRRPNGTVLKTIGGPMPGGGYVTTFTDITEEKRTQAALSLANEGLEERVRARTVELEQEAALNRRLAEALHVAKHAADAANASKTKFLAAASHDLLQPLHAARLFNQAVVEGLDPAGKDGLTRLAQNTDKAIASADRLLRTLLDISKLEAGGITPQPVRFPISLLIEELAREFDPLAKSKGLRMLSREPCDCGVFADRVLLRQILQNLIANAVRYTARGGVLIGCRWRKDSVRVEVWDTGPGIAADRLETIFKEFARFDQPGQSERGAGLGLSIASRSAALIGAKVTVRSRVGKGSVFAVDIPRADGACVTTVGGDEADADAAGDVAGKRVLCVDNEAVVLAGVTALIAAWGASPVAAGDYESAVCAEGPFDAALVDLHLDGPETGLDVAAALRANGHKGLIAIVTADPDAADSQRVAALGLQVMAKPLNPGYLRSLIVSDGEILQTNTD